MILGGCTALPPPPSGPRFLQIGEAETRDGYSTLYVYRTFDLFELELSKEVFLNDTKVIGLPDSGYTVLYVKPGKYRVRVESPSKRPASKDPAARINILPDTKNFLRFYVSSYSNLRDAKYIVINGIPLLDGENEHIVEKRWVFQERSDVPQPLKGCRYIAPYVTEVSP